ncbi:DMT family transporter [Ihubacter massiliensis]|uniref:DMT family transporter n=1 Tax=Hominibacterium faecale TaxID=2839743 RepID=A0A9J6QX78_9FIRM|nr:MULTISPECIES: DMT family transporter [Eubacteriales Family XIII. Incertae Sedis]MCO7122238.1 DMT family transporter [Ihubacter massiliensis]MCU7380100.1 DMT family transporter [Hominibacterium faecale]
MNKGKKIYGFMVLAALFWSGAFIAGKYAVPFIPTFTLTFLRFFFASLILCILSGAARKKEEDRFRLKKEHLPIFLFTGIVGMFGYHVFFFIALKYTTAINSSIIGAMNPIVTIVIAALFLRNKIPAKQIAGILLSFFGVLLTITGADVETLVQLDFNRGDLWMAAAVICWAAYGVFSKSKGAGIPPFWLTYYSFLVCTLILIPFVIWEKPWQLLAQAPPQAWIAVLYMSIFASVAGYMIQQIAIKQIGPSKTSIFINLVPVFSMVLATLILGEALAPIKLATAGIIILGGCICQFSGSADQKG